MSIFSKFNKSFKPINVGYAFTCDSLKDIPFKHASDLFAQYPDMEFKVRAFYTAHNSDYGDQLVGVCEGEEDSVCLFRLGFPRSFVEEIDSENEEIIQAVNQGSCSFRIRKYHSKKWNKECYTVEFN